MKRPTTELFTLFCPGNYLYIIIAIANGTMVPLTEKKAPSTGLERMRIWE